MSLGLAFALLLAVPSVLPAQTPEPSAAALASSVVVFDPAGSVTVYDVKGSVTALRTKVTVGSETVVTISSDVLFDFGSAALSPPATATVKDLVAQIARTPKPVAVIGYTDSVGDATFNLDLSTQRAKAVGAILQAGLPAAQITTEGRGAANPVAPNTEGGKDSPEGRAKNRRVTISFTPPGP